MLSHEQNAELTRVGAGTPAGELMRRYWQPVGPAAELTAENPKKKIRVMGEELVLFRDGSGRFGLVEEQCCHRSASLLYGFVEDDGLRCPYHGWKFDCTGKCIEMPFEPKDTTLINHVRQRAYPVRELGGMLWTYMGPGEAPELPRWAQLLRKDGVRRIDVLPLLDCNWLQVMENSCDPCHTYYLHAHTLVLKGKGDMGTYYYRPIEKMHFEIVEEPNWVGVRKQRIYGGDEAEEEDGHPVIFPNFLLSPQREHLVMHMRLPVDDTHTQIYRYQFTPTEDGSEVPQPNQVPFQNVPPLRDEYGVYHMNSFASHDAMAWETQGPITDRSRENLGVSDAGIALYRRLLREQIKRVQEGKDPKGLIRDPKLNEYIDIHVSTGQARVAHDQKRQSA
jgi:5,5'-dehydrodivanillate O-demethylase